MSADVTTPPDLRGVRQGPKYKSLKQKGMKQVAVSATLSRAQWMCELSDAVRLPQAEVISEAVRLFAESRGFKAPPKRNPGRSW